MFFFVYFNLVPDYWVRRALIIVFEFFKISSNDLINIH